MANGQAVFGGCDGLLHVISLADGKQVKEVEAGAYIAGSVALADGRAYFGQYENEFLCVDLKEGKKAGPFTTGTSRILFPGGDAGVRGIRRPGQAAALREARRRPAGVEFPDARQSGQLAGDLRGQSGRRLG